MNIKIIIGLILLAVIIFSGWLFWWPLTECWYAWSWEPLLLDAHKFYSFILGGILFWGAVLGGIKVLI